ncbi:hypothetical protein AB0D67_09200 [Streptosporangium sp. NPDC048047]|uniref:hypothetical protein n=1 Tax=Streptosporangium sp. NPDC048047 TaxID=3155748 RepID=UPI0034456EBD
MMDVSTPSAYTALVNRYGAPLGVEEARTHWGALVRAAREGRTTLITREHWEWAALVPMSEVTGPMMGLPTWPATSARAKLGDLVRQAGRPSGSAILLTRHRTPIAALCPADSLAPRPVPPDLLDAEALLRDGAQIVLRFGPERTGRLDDDGAAAAGPVEPVYHASVRGPAGIEVAAGSGAGINEALQSLRPHHRPGITDHPSL